MNLEEEIARALDSAYPMSRESAIDTLVPVVKRAQAEARAEGWEAAAHRVIAMVDGDGMIDQHRVVFMTNPYDRIESEVPGV